MGKEMSRGHRSHRPGQQTEGEGQGRDRDPRDKK